MTLQEFAHALRGHDWYYAFSDDGRVFRQGQAAEAKLKRHASLDTGRRESRLWELASSYHLSHNQNDQAYENAWRWAGAYLWAHGISITESQAKNFVGKTDTVDWRAIDEKIEEFL